MKVIQKKHREETFTEIKNTEHIVKLKGSNGTIIQWNFVYDPFNSMYYAEQFVGRSNKCVMLAKDRPSAVKLWNSVIRHKKEFLKE